MKRNSNALAPNEAKFAERKHHILEEYINYHNLSKEEFYDVLALGYIEGIKRYCRDNANGCDLKDILYRFMDKAYMKHISHSEKESPVIYSFYEEICGGRTYEDIIADTKMSIDAAIDNISLKETIQSFDETQRQILRLLFDGYRYSEVAKKLNMSANAFANQLNTIRKMLAADVMPAAA